MNRRWSLQRLLPLFLLSFLIILPLHAKKKPPLHLIPAEACGECHQAIYNQWSGSMHANSTALKDKVHAAFYGLLIGDPTKEGVKHKKSGKYPVCLKCHAPNAARDGKTKLDANPAYAQGVNCVACHTMQSFKGVKGEDGKLNLGVSAYHFSKNHLQGPYGAFNGTEDATSPGSGSDEKFSNSFPHQAKPELFQTSNACLGCHEQRKNGHGVPVCATGPELAKAGSKVTCQSCHMPISNGFADHSMGGGHSPAMLKRGIVLSVEAQSGEQEIKAKVKLQNILPHNYPTGAPFRYVTLTLSAKDKQGKVIWKNYQKSPFKEDKQAVLMLKLTGKDGKPAPPPKATAIKGDSRLKPHEIRMLDYTIPKKGVTHLEARLHYGLLLPPIVKKMDKKLPPEAKKPVLIQRFELPIQP
ncbi:multiheme c-type cytochrome [Magnetococcales bacterium HHB-1]